jgi:hypothetical protein
VNAGNTCFIARSPEHSIASPSTKITVSPRVCPGPSQISLTRGSGHAVKSTNVAPAMTLDLCRRRYTGKGTWRFERPARASRATRRRRVGSASGQATRCRRGRRARCRWARMPACPRRCGIRPVSGGGASRSRTRRNAEPAAHQAHDRLIREVHSEVLSNLRIGRVP